MIACLLYNKKRNIYPSNMQKKKRIFFHHFFYRKNKRLQELCKIKKSIFWLTDFLSLHVEVYSFAYIISFKPNRFFGRWSVAVSLNVSHSPKISFSKAGCCSSFFSKHSQTFFSPFVGELRDRGDGGK